MHWKQDTVNEKSGNFGNFTTILRFFRVTRYFSEGIVLAVISSIYYKDCTDNETSDTLTENKGFILVI